MAFICFDYIGLPVNMTNQRLAKSSTLQVSDMKKGSN